MRSRVMIYPLDQLCFFFVEKEHLNKMFPFPTKRYLVYKTVLLKLYLSWKGR